MSQLVRSWNLSRTSVNSLGHSGQVYRLVDRNLRALRWWWRWALSRRLGMAATRMVRSHSGHSFVQSKQRNSGHGSGTPNVDAPTSARCRPTHSSPGHWLVLRTFGCSGIWFPVGPWPDAVTGPRLATPFRRWSRGPRKVGRLKFQSGRVAGVRPDRLHRW